MLANMIQLTHLALLVRAQKPLSLCLGKKKSPIKMKSKKKKRKKTITEVQEEKLMNEKSKREVRLMTATAE